MILKNTELSKFCCFLSLVYTLFCPDPFVATVKWDSSEFIKNMSPYINSEKYQVSRKINVSKKFTEYEALVS